MAVSFSVFCAFLLLVASPLLASTQYSCVTTWMVDQDAGTDCRGLSLDNRTDGVVCRSLQDALVALSADATSSSSSSSCVEIIIRPGRYNLLRTVNITHSVVLRAESPHSVTVAGHSLDTANTQPLYTISFSNAEFVQVEGIQFTNGPVAIGIVNVTSVVIHDCTFRNFVQGALDIYNCLMVNVTFCLFEYNGPAAVVKTDNFRGHSGGLSLAYSSLASSARFSVRNCNFSNNTADPSSLGNQRTTSQAFRQRIFTGRGGGLAILIRGTDPVTGSVNNCIFTDNRARSFGGGLYTVQSGLSNHTINVSDSLFIGNSAETGAGGMLAGFIDGGDSHNSNKLIAVGCTFVRNTSPHGGAIKSSLPFRPNAVTVPLGNFARFQNCTFRENVVPEFGAAIGIFSLNLFGFRELVKPMEIIDCVFIANRGGSGGTVSTAYFPLTFFGENTFIDNIGPGLQVVGSSVSVDGTISFTGNDAEHVDGGALYMQSFGQLRLKKGSQLHFKNNTGKFGSSVVVESQRVTSVLSQLLFNPLCPFLYEQLKTPPNKWNNVSVSFAGNQALVGSAVFMNHFDLCSWTELEYPFFDLSAVFNWRFVHYSGGDINTAHGNSSQEKQWYIQSPAFTLTTTAQNLLGYPGENVSIAISARDELGKSTVGAFRISDQLTEHELHVDFSPTVVAIDNVDETISSSYYSHNPNALSTQHRITLNSILSVEEINTNFRASLELCPPGYVLTNLTRSETVQVLCSCDQNNTNIVGCEGRQIILSEHLWAGSDAMSSLHVYPCPEGYCQCQEISENSCFNIYNSSSPDSQCTCTRQGVLCGDCKDNNGVSALLNKCVTCSDVSGLLIAALVVADCFLYVAILIAMIPTPSWVLPCLFYVQVIPYLLEHPSLSFDKVYPYLYFISSALSFYFPYDFCLYSNMSALVSYSLRFIPLFTAIIVCPIVLIIRHKVMRYKVPWHGVWLIVLQLFPHLAYTATSVLRCPQLPNEDGQLSSRWFVNGSTTCFAGGHIGLSVLAICALLLMVFVVIFCFLALIGIIKGKTVVRCVLPALTYSLKEHVKVWPIVELSRRLVIVLAVVAFPGNQYPSMFVVMLVVMLYGYVQPFKSTLSNIVETVLAVDTLILLILSNTSQLRDSGSSLSLFTTSINGCTQTESHGITELVALMTVFYYFPLLVLLVAVAVIPVSWCWKRYRSIPYSRLRTKRHRSSPEVWATNSVAVSEMYFSSEGGISMDSIRSSKRCVATTSDCYYLYSETNDS